MTLVFLIHHELIATSFSSLPNIITDNSAPLLSLLKLWRFCMKASDVSFSSHATDDVTSPRHLSMTDDVALRMVVAQTDDVYV